jgi:hypothetical protein
MIKNTDPKKNMVRIPIEVMDSVIKEAIVRDMEPHRLIAWILENRYQGVNPTVLGVDIVVAENSTNDVQELITSAEKTEFKLSREPRKLILE